MSTRINHRTSPAASTLKSSRLTRWLKFLFDRRTAKPTLRNAIIEPLENRALLAAVTWDAGGDNTNWHDALNWSNDTLPTADDDVTINTPGTPSIKFTAAAGDVVVNSLNSSESLTLQAGSLSVLTNLNINASHLYLAGGTIKNATINSSGASSVMGTPSGGTLTNVTVNANINLRTYNSNLTFNNLTLNGTASLGQLARLHFNSNQTLSGTGVVEFAGYEGGITTTAADLTLTIGSDITIRSSNTTQSQGSIGYVGPTFGSESGPKTTIINYGAINSSFAGSFISIRPNGSTFTNHGTVQATQSATIRLDGLDYNHGLISTSDSALVVITGNWSNKGEISVNQGNLDLGGTFKGFGTKFTRIGGLVQLIDDLDNTGFDLKLDASTGSLRIYNASIKGGTITTSGGAQILTNYGTLDGVTVNGEINLKSNHLYIRNGLTLNGTATVGSGDLHFEGTQTVSGNGVFNLDGGTFIARTDNMSLTLGPGITLNANGRSLIGDSSYYPTGSNYSIISYADINVSGQSAVVDISSSTGKFLNHGTVAIDDGARLSIYSLAGNTGLIQVDAARLFISGVSSNDSTGTITASTNSRLHFSDTWTNAGVINADGGLVEFNGTWTNTGSISAINADVYLSGTYSSKSANFDRSGSSLTLSGTIDNLDSAFHLSTDATFSYLTVNGGTISGTKPLLLGYGSTLNGVTIVGNVDLPYGTLVTVTNGLSLTGTMTLQKYAQVNFSGTQTITGTGNIQLAGNNSALVSTLNNMTLTISKGINVSNSYSAINTYIGANGTTSNTTVINYGTIKSDASSAHLTINPNGDFINHGTVSAQQSSTVSIRNLTQSDGLLSASTQGKLLISGSWTNHGTVNAQSAGSITTGALTGINSGSFQSSPDASIEFKSSLLTDITDASKINLAGTTLFNSGATVASPQFLEVTSPELGPLPDGSLSNVQVATLTLAGKTYLKLVDLFDNTPGSDEPEVIYVDSLNIPAGSTLDLNGLRLYANHSQIDGLVVNGTLTLDTPVLSKIFTPGDVHEWSIDAPVGTHVTIAVDGSATLPGASEFSSLKMASVEVVDGSNTVISSMAQYSFILDYGTVLPAFTIQEGVQYKVRVKAYSDHGGRTGTYRILARTEYPPVAHPVDPLILVEDKLAILDLRNIFDDSFTPDGSLKFSVESISDPLLVKAIFPFPELRIVPLRNRSGSATIVIKATDSFGLSALATIQVQITPANDAPSFIGFNPRVIQDAGPKTVLNWARFNAGADDESSQTATYTVTEVSNPSLFSVLPTIDPAGTLTYTPAPGTYGTSTFSAKVQDSGGTSNSGVDTSAIWTYTITVTDLPSAAPTIVSISSFPTPRTQPVLTVAFRTSDMVDPTSLNQFDLTFMRSGTLLSVSSTSITVSPTDPTLYTVHLPASLVNAVGVYTLTVKGAGIYNYFNTKFTNTQSTTWTIIANTPSAPTLNPLSEGTPGSGFTSAATPSVTGTATPRSTIEIYENSVLLGSGKAASDGKYGITLSTLSDGVHTIKARATDPSGAFSDFSSISTITVEAATPTISNMSVYTAPRTIPVTTTGIRFSSQIDLSTFTAADLTLTRNGSAASTAGITITPSAVDPKLFTINIPAALNPPDGNYVLKVNGAGLKNLAGSTVGNNLSTSWTVLPQIISLSQYTAPRSVPVTTPGVRFYSPVNLSTFTWKDITLTRDGSGNLATSAITIVQSGSDASLYTIVIPGGLTITPGIYTLTVVGSGIQFLTGLTLISSKSTTWTQI